MKNLIISGASIFVMTAIAFVALPGHALAWGSGCPTYNTYYANGYSNTYCTPSNVPPPTYTYGGGYNGGYSNSGNGYTYGGTGAYYGGSYNQPYYPYLPVATYYYPSHNYGNGYTYGGSNGGNGYTYGNGGYNGGGYNNGGTYNGGGYNGGNPGGGWRYAY